MHKVHVALCHSNFRGKLGFKYLLLLHTSQVRFTGVISRFGMWRVYVSAKYNREHK